MTPDEGAEILRSSCKEQIRYLRSRLRMDTEPWKHRIVAPSLTGDPVTISVILTLDEGTHASGWWRNSEYDRCQHLSMCAIDPTGKGYLEMPEIDRRAWPRAIFGSRHTMTWWEPAAEKNDAYRNAPASAYTHHVRLFLDRRWVAIIPKGEVYTLIPWEQGDSPAKVFRT